MSLWVEVERRTLPTGPGVYVVYQHDQLVYVGSTTELRHRCRVYRRKPRLYGDYDDTAAQINEAQRKRKMWRTPWGFVPPHSIRIKVKRSRRLGDWLMWEHRLIARLQPKHNRLGVET